MSSSVTWRDKCAINQFTIGISDYYFAIQLTISQASESITNLKFPRNLLFLC